MPEKLPQRLAFLPVSKARTNKLYIFRQFTYMINYVSVYYTAKFSNNYTWLRYRLLLFSYIVF